MKKTKNETEKLYILNIRKLQIILNSNSEEFFNLYIREIKFKNLYLTNIFLCSFKMCEYLKCAINL